MLEKFLPATDKSVFTDAAVHQALTAPPAMTDEELELHIKGCGVQMHRCHALYTAFGCKDDLAEAHEWRKKMELAIASRSAAQVQALEKARGLHGK
jgi:hypothetical protein